MGDGKVAIVYPIPGGASINVAAFYGDDDKYNSTYDGKWMRDATPEEMRSHFEGWDKEFTSILEVASHLIRSFVVILIFNSAQTARLPGPSIIWTASPGRP